MKSPKELWNEAYEEVLEKHGLDITDPLSPDYQTKLEHEADELSADKQADMIDAIRAQKKEEGL